MKSMFFGMGTLGIGPSQRDLSTEEGGRIIGYALDRGISLLDTAQYYDTYPYIRWALDRLREEDRTLPMISSRTLCEGYEEAKDAVLSGLEALSIPCFKVFMLHEVRSMEDFRARSGAFRALKDLRSQGKINRIGISTHHTDVALAASRIDDVDVLFCLLNKDALGIRTGDRPGTREAMETAITACHDAGKTVWAMKVFGGGNLVADYRECLDYALSVPGLDGVIIGMATEEDVDAAVSYMDETLSVDYKPDTSQKRMFIEQTDCEGCGSCKARCNSDAIFWNKNGLAEIDQSKCVRCGYCAPVCPVRAIIYF